jgi:hypothetical protein
MGKSIHEPMVINNSKTITYAECCKQYFNELNHVDQLTMICIKCSHHLQRIYSLHNDADELTKQMRQTLSKTKRLNRIRSSNSDDITIIAVKNEPAMIPKPIEPVHVNTIFEILFFFDNFLRLFIVSIEYCKCKFSICSDKNIEWKFLSHE